jgi:nucleotide-binding universal stress UspA family protein
VSTMFQKTGVAFDGSDDSFAALDQIAAIVGAAGGEVNLVMVLDSHLREELTQYAETSGSGPREPSTPGAPPTYIDQAVDALISAAEAELSNHGVRADSTIVSDGDTVDGILQGAREAGCTSLVLPTHGRSGLQRWLAGNHTEKIIHEARIPVLVIPPRA